MRLFCFLVVCGIVVCGCAGNKPAAPKRGAVATQKTPPVLNSSNTNSTLLVTPGNQLTGRLTSVNSVSRFVIATFPVGMMPAVNQRLNVYREGLKVGVIRITGPQRDVNIAGDIVTGDCQAGDEVRAD